MNFLVFLFFLHTVIATFLLGGKFVMRRNDGVFRSFGISLLFDAIAFTIWLFGLVRPENLLISITLGAISFLISLVFLFHVSFQQAQQINTRWLLTALGSVFAFVIFYVGRYYDPTDAYISSEGLLFFNLGPIVQMLYIFGLSLAALPAIDLLASKFKLPYSALVRYGFIAEVVGGIMLITSKDVSALYIAGWIMGVVYFILWTTLLFNKKAWSAVN